MIYRKNKMKTHFIINFVVLCYVIICSMITKVTWAQSNNNNTSSLLRIAIPVREFSHFVVIDRDPVTGENNYSGFAIEVFKAVMSALPSPVSYEFVPFARPDGSMNGTFDDMLKAVESKDYQGAVGDISILFYRTQYVDFTMPYLESSITMLVPIKRKPTSNDEGPSLTSIAYTSAITTFGIGVTVAFAYACIGCCFRPDLLRDRTMKSRMHIGLLILSLATIFITLIASYISSESCTLTSQGKYGSVKNLNQLIRMGSNVGYREGSFIYNLLIQKGIPQSRLISLKSEHEMVQMLSKGTAKGGVDAIVANAPHLKLLRSKHCNDFTTVPTTNLHATGFGFAFERGSDIVMDVSKAILKIVDNGQLGKIQDRTLGSLETCQDEPSSVDANASSLALHRKLIFYIGIVLAGIFVIMSLFFLGWSLRAA